MYDGIVPKGRPFFTSGGLTFLRFALSNHLCYFIALALCISGSPFFLNLP
jgi:hypothetical protein